MIEVSKQAPDFSLPSHNGVDIKLSDFKGNKNVVIFFYPKDNTPGWANEASEFRDHYNEFKSFDTEVIGISKDSLKSHEKFSDKYNLPFHLLSDEDRKVHELYDVLKPKKMFGKEVIGTIRSTFVINKEGILIKDFRKVKTKGHAEEVLNYLKEIIK